MSLSEGHFWTSCLPNINFGVAKIFTFFYIDYNKFAVYVRKEAKCTSPGR